MLLVIYISKGKEERVIIDNEIEDILKGDYSAFDSIVKKYQNKIFKYCFFLLSNEQEAEDATQETFIKAFFQIHSYRYNKSFIGWLYMIALNHCRTLLKRRSKWRDGMLKLTRWSEEFEPSAEDAYLSHNSCLLAEYKILSETEKSILILHTVENYTFVEISNILEIRTPTVRKKFERIKIKLIEKNEDKKDRRYLNEQKIEI
ncbi:sigma-70 family RNA polymerase sigma factor [Paenibacillus tritici]|uniref:Sigma-70 family RNA polymerase sigma factor n=1 Tax=Paenibacillus tritici TaxID=1873425 RepID=A0ABX2DNM3_9BACL|nr:sigma-70 family RNA polymerase sigma factor [Paenibacillus tritici]NQX45451.1 sigma-70 family RNA polymerase sigma factor [Paenibacillus tritici]